MGVKVNISSILAQSTGNQTVVTVEGSTVAECLDDLIKRFPDLRKSLFDKDGKLHSFLDIYVNKQSAYPETLAKPVKEGDEIHIMFLIGGG